MGIFLEIKEIEGIWIKPLSEVNDRKINCSESHTIHFVIAMYFLSFVMKQQSQIAKSDFTDFSNNSFHWAALFSHSGGSLRWPFFRQLPIYYYIALFWRHIYDGVVFPNPFKRFAIFVRRTDTIRESSFLRISLVIICFRDFSFKDPFLRQISQFQSVSLGLNNIFWRKMVFPEMLAKAVKCIFQM